MALQNGTPFHNKMDRFSDLVQTCIETGRVHATKQTSPDGFHLDITVGTNKLQATSTLTTTVGGPRLHAARQRNATCQCVA
ncbi:hypothetical protein AB0M31_14650 [Streptomyces sp. NPDC051773]